MQEDCVTFEQAKLLKEKGFPELDFLGDIGMDVFFQPTLAIVQKWFRKEKDIHIAPECEPDVDSYGNVLGSYYDIKIIVFDFKNETSNTIYLDKTYKEYEEALSAGIDKALTLI